MKAVIPLAGFGTRFLPITKAQAKEMLPIYDKPTIQYVIEEAVASGIDDILIVTGRNKRSIENHFDKSYELEYALQRAGKDRDLKKIRKITDLADITYTRQKNLNGLGDALKYSQKHVNDEAFAVLLGHTITKGNTPCLKQLINVYEKYQKPTVSLKKVQNISKYRIITGCEVENNIYTIDKILEKPKKAPTNLAIMGRYILTPDIFDKIKKTEHDNYAEIHLTDALSKLDSIYGVVCKGKSYYIENKLDWLTTSIEFGLDDKEFRNELIEYMKNRMKISSD